MCGSANPKADFRHLKNSAGRQDQGSKTQSCLPRSKAWAVAGIERNVMVIFLIKKKVSEICPKITAISFKPFKDSGVLDDIIHGPNHSLSCQILRGVNHSII